MDVDLGPCFFTDVKNGHDGHLVICQNRFLVG